LEFVPDLSTPQRIAILRKVLPIISEIEPRAQSMTGASESRRHELVGEIQGLAQKYREIVQHSLTPEQYTWAVYLPTEAAARRRFFRTLPLQLQLQPAQRACLIKLHQAALEVKKESSSLEERYWSIVSLILTPEQIQALAHRLPLERPARLPENYLFLPGLTASQGNQVLARARGMEAEMADRITRVRQLEGQLKSAAAQQRPALLEEMLTIQAELSLRHQQLEEDLKAIVNPQQRRALERIVPGLKISRFQEALFSLLQAKRLTPDQRTRMERWSSELRQMQQKVQPELEKRATAMAETSLDNDAGMTGLVGVRQLELPLRQAQRRVAEQLVPTLSADQFRDWLESQP
jgi:hypothetical protein